MFCVTFSFTLVKQRLESSGFSLIFKVLKVSEAILLIPVNLIWKLFIHVTNIRKSSTSWVGSVIQLNQLELKFTWTSCGRDACWLLNVPATCYCISGTDLLRQFMCCHTEIEAADQTFYLTQSQYTDTEPTSPERRPCNVRCLLWQRSAHTVKHGQIHGCNRSEVSRWHWLWLVDESAESYSASLSDLVISV